MSNTVKQLGFTPTNRGEFDTTGQTRYYKDNVVQYRNGSYICTPVGYSSSNLTAYTTDAPYQDGDTQLNANWKLMASVGLVDNEPTAGSDNLVNSKGVALELYPLKKDLIHNEGLELNGLAIYGLDLQGKLYENSDRGIITNIPIDYNLIYCVGSESYRYTISFYDKYYNKIGDSGWKTVDHIDLTQYLIPEYKTFAVMVDLTVMSLSNLIISKNESLPRKIEKKIYSEKITSLKNSNFYIYHNLSEGRVRALSLNSGSLKIKILNLPAGFSYSIVIFNTLNPSTCTGSAVYDTTWQTDLKEYNFSYPKEEAKYFNFAFKKNSGSLTNADVETILNEFSFELYFSEDDSIDEDIQKLKSDVTDLKSDIVPMKLSDFENFFEVGGIDTITDIGLILPYNPNSERLHSILLKKSECQKIFISKNPANQHYVSIIGFDANNNLLSDYGWQNSQTSVFSEIVDEDYFKLVIDFSVVEPSDCTLYVKREYKDYITNFLEDYSRNNAKYEIALNNAPIVSQPPTELMSHASTMQIDAEGNVYISYYCNEQTTVESPLDIKTYPKLITTTLASLDKKTEYVPLRANETITNSDDTTFTQGNYPPYDPNLLLLNGTLMNFLATNFNGIGVRVFDTNSKTFGNMYQCKLNWEVEGVVTSVDFNCAGLVQCASAFDRTLPSDLNYTIMMGDRFIYNSTDGYYYIALGTFANIPAFILKTNDGINFSFVCMSPINDDDGNALYCSEPCIELLDDDTIMFITRKYNGGATGNIAVGKYKISTDTWDYCKKLTNGIDAKPSIVKVNNKLYIVYNCGGNLVNDFGTINRTKMTFCEIDENFKETIISQFVRTDAIHYPFFFPYKGALYMIYTEDRRKMNPSYMRSNISLVKLI